MGSDERVVAPIRQRETFKYLDEYTSRPPVSTDLTD